jgi:hypothetical protein
MVLGRFKTLRVLDFLPSLAVAVGGERPDTSNTRSGRHDFQCILVVV